MSADLASPSTWQRYWQRHRHPVNRWLHVVGVPLCFAVAPAVALVQLADGAWDLWWRPAALFAWGYALQFVGHAIEGNDAGEVCLVLRLLGRPYVAVAPAKAGDATADE